jgi:hypothetical protein
MPKYTIPQPLSGSTVIRSTDWNAYFGASGNLRWAYDELNNINGTQYVMLKNATNATSIAINTPYRFENYPVAYGNIDNCNIATGVVKTPMHAGYVWMSACVSHTISTTIGITSAPYLRIGIVDIKDSYSSLTTATTMQTYSASTNRGWISGAAPTYYLTPLVPSLSISCIVPVINGASRYQLVIWCNDTVIAAGKVVVNHFTMTPLGDVSGMANFLNELEQVIE